MGACMSHGESRSGGGICHIKKKLSPFSAHVKQPTKNFTSCYDWYSYSEAQDAEFHYNKPMVSLRHFPMRTF